MKALQIKDNAKQRIAIVELPMPTIQAGQALVKVKAVALNHRDQWIREGKYPKIKFDCTLGSDGCGVVEQVASKTDEYWLGKDVIINPNNEWGKNPVVQSHSEYHVLGMPTNGTFAEYIVVNVDRLHEKPSHLSYERAAALPLAGLTAYRAVFTQGHVQKGKNVLISGVGGGVALFAFQFAVASGANVYATSSSDDKLDKAKKIGAKGTANYTQPDWNKQLLEDSQGFDLVIDSGGGENFNNLIKMMRPAGHIVFYGATQGLPAAIDLYRAFYNQLRIQGTTMGNDIEFDEMIKFIAGKKLIPVVDSIRPFDQIISAFDEMQAGVQFGKLVVKF
jgi:zinc-binding alcohol dehydrogenase/oxidoreductase